MVMKRGQVTIFVILAILVVAGVASYFVFRDSVSQQRISEDFEPVYENFLSCLEQNTQDGIDVLETRGGYIELPDFKQGSEYSPFSSQLNFLGVQIPYWYYVSGNGLERTQIPSKSSMEEQLGNFVDSQMRDCLFDSYTDKGYEIYLGEASSKVNIRNNEVVVETDMDFSIAKSGEDVLIDSHEVSVDSNLGELYDDAKEIYDKEQEELFLEEYGVDVLRLYAPVDGVEVSCSSEVWNADKIYSDLVSAVESNTLALKSSGDNDDYFVVDSLKTGVSNEVRFVNSKNWSNSFEVVPSEGNLLMADPVGNQEGLGILGFCYVPYHFVYDLKYPVLVQVYSDSEEIFQFPMAVVIDNNKPREGYEGEAVSSEDFGICNYKNVPVEVSTYDSDFNSVDSDVYFECFGERCFIGNADSGVLNENFPQCVNGRIIAKADGYETSEEVFSTASSGSVSLILDKKHSLDVELNLEGSDYDSAIISFVSENSSSTISYPEQSEIELVEGQYEIRVRAYEEKSLELGTSNIEKCIDVEEGVLGSLGISREKCFTVEVPDDFVSNVISGGGSADKYLLESELKTSNTLIIDAPGLEVPESIEKLQENYILVEQNELEVELR